MPFYDLDCPNCGEVVDVFMRIAETDDPKCAECNAPARIIPRAIHLDIFKAQWYEHLDHEPKYVTSKKQLRDICNKNGLTCWHSVDGERGPDVKEV